MSNDGKSTETQAVPVVPDAATTPIDLASAFKMLNQANRETAQNNLEPSGTSEGDEPEGDEGDAGENQQLPNAEGDSSMADPDISGGDDLDGGSASGIQAIDFNAYKQDLLREVQANAIQQVRKEFNDQNIGYYTAGELTVRDEQTGRIMFRNPDVQDERDPNYYFSSRSEMQQFIDAWNKSIDTEFRRAVNEKQQELYAYAAPKARLADFLPRWQKMDDNTKAVFDELLEGHEIRDKSGKEIGYNIDLDAVANQAEKIAKRFNRNAPVPQGEQQQKQQQAGDGNLALDMPTGNGKSDDDIEPKSIGEALKLIDKRNKGEK